MLVKVCGITEKTNISELEGRVNLLGFIFYPPSPRNAFETSTEFIKRLGQKFEKVGVFVDYPIDHLVFLCRQRNIRTVQLHGRETPEYARILRELGFKVIKAFSISSETHDHDFTELTLPYEEVVDMFLFDTAGKNAGGNGVKFNWELLKRYKGKTPYLLSGGIGPQDISLITSLQPEDYPGLAGFDLNSRFEISPGEKNTVLLSEFIDSLKI